MIPNHDGKLIVEDTQPNLAPRFLEDYPLGAQEVFEVRQYDLCNPRPPAKGAKVYYLLTVLNQLHDRDSLSFLEQLKQALVPGYSIVLIDDIVLPAQDTSWPVTAVDRLNYLTGNSRKRTEAEFITLIEAAGFKVRKTYRAPLCWTTLMELELLPDPGPEAGPEAGPSGQHD